MEDFLAYVTIRTQPWQTVSDKIADSPMGDIMYRLEHIDFSNVMDISVSQPLLDELDREDQMLEAKLRTKFASSPARHLEKAIFGAP
jgi:hypothetical protein